MSVVATPSAPPTKFTIPQIPVWRSLLVLILGGLTAGLCLMNSQINSATEAGVVLNLPAQVGDYWGTDTDITVSEKTILPADTEFARKTYDTPQGEKIMCSIVLAGKEQRSIHRPEACLPAQGWTVKTATVVPVTLKNGHVLRVTDLLLDREVEIREGKRIHLQSHYLYWFVGKNVATPSHWTRVLLTSWDRVVHHVNHRWAYVIVNGFITNPEHPEQTLDSLKKFIAEVTPTFQKSEMGH